ncbi:MAG TPA: hypothetical protein PLA54_11935 [Spirochaetota bacterium]|nr:hypothetical protein [Spirochaetota bacterium]HQE59887.1 hypothetical protein [Spirochaetota bacterium]
MKLKGLLTICIIFSSCLWARVEGGSKSDEFRKKIVNIKRILILTPKIDIYEIDVGGICEKRDDWSNEAIPVFKDSISYLFKINNIETVFINPADEKSQETKDLRAIIPVVAGCARAHTHPSYNGGLDTFRTKYNNFDYTVGSVQEILQKYNADAIFFITAEDEEATTGRKARKVLNVINPFSAHMSTALTYAFAALIANDGILLWQNWEYTEDSYDFRKRHDSDEILSDIFYDLPKFKRDIRPNVEPEEKNNTDIEDSNE